MLKSSKLSHKQHKPSKDSSMRKSHLSKKTLRSRSPVRVSGNSRPSSIKHISPGMKRGHLIPKRKSSHSPRLRSIASSPHRSLSHRNKESPVSIDRSRSLKGLKYEKRKNMSNSPVRHLGPSTSRRPVSPHAAHDISPYEVERYQSSSTVLHSPQYSSPTRKKTRREPDRYFTSRSVSASPPRRHAVASLHPESRISPRPEASPPSIHHRHRRNIPVGHGEQEKHNYEIRHKHLQSSLDIPSSRLKETSVKVPYASESSRYRSSSPASRYPSGSKSYGPTLHERFSSVIISNRSEPRIHYSREDLEKITIDIRRNPRDASPTLRHIVNPSEVKLVRRANEGHRPIFDRDEIKQAARDLREDAYYERKASEPYSSSRPIDLREVENYQITRHRFDNHHDIFSSGSGRTLSERFQSHAGRKDGISLDRDEREKEYQRIPVSRGYVDSRSRSRSGDRDFRSERYLDAKTSSNSRSEYQRLPVDPPESRSSIPYPHRKGSMPLDARHKLNVKKGDRENHSSSIRSDIKSHYPPEHRHYSDVLPPPRVDRRDHHHSPLPESHYKSRSPSREKFSEFSRRPDKYSYKSWIDKPDISPKSPSFFAESRETTSSYASRGSSRPFRSSRGFRTRGFRGPMRGSSYYRGSFRGYRSSSSPRGRGIPRR